MDRFKKFTHRQFKNLIKHLKGFHASDEPEILHQVRVDIKKIKSIIHMINAADKDFRVHKNFVPFRTIFRKAGSIREPNVMKDLLSKYQIGDVSSELLVADDVKLTDFKSEIPAWIVMVKKKMRKIESSSRKVKRHEVEKYLRGKRKSIRSQLYPWVDIPALHKVRKSIKELTYLSKFEVKRKKKSEEFYDDLESVIGQLHDKQVLLKFLDSNSVSDLKSVKMIQSACLADEEKIRLLANRFYE